MNARYSELFSLPVPVPFEGLEAARIWLPGLCLPALVRQAGQVGTATSREIPLGGYRSSSLTLIMFFHEYV